MRNNQNCEKPIITFRPVLFHVQNEGQDFLVGVGESDYSPAYQAWPLMDLNKVEQRLIDAKYITHLDKRSGRRCMRTGVYTQDQFKHDLSLDSFIARFNEVPNKNSLILTVHQPKSQDVSRVLNKPDVLIPSTLKVSRGRIPYAGIDPRHIQTENVMNILEATAVRMNLMEANRPDYIEYEAVVA